MPEFDPATLVPPAPTPLNEPPLYRPPRLLAGAHRQTVYPTLFRRVPMPAYQRERMATPDGDFLDLDWCRRGRRRLAVICHGLESNSGAQYVRGLVRAVDRAGWDALAVNLRGCGGAPNRLLRSYHSGATEDLAAVLAHPVLNREYGTVVLAGFSLGGNLVFKYAAENGAGLPETVAAVVGISVPCDLAAGSHRLEEPANRFYHWRFLRSLKAKLRNKCKTFPDRLDWRRLRHIRSLREFDDLYTAPVHGFAGASDYYRRCSCGPLLDQVAVPALIVNAADDPFLAPSCFPFDAAAVNPNLHLLIPRHGGHVGFVTTEPDGCYWHERKILEFLENLAPDRCRE